MWKRKVLKEPVFLHLSCSRTIPFSLLSSEENKTIASEEIFLEVEEAKTLLEECLVMQ